jgi:hypothetical protein
VSLSAAFKMADIGPRIIVWLAFLDIFGFLRPFFRTFS